MGENVNFEFINKITNDKAPELFRPLVNGYVKSLTDEQAMNLIKKYALDRKYSSSISRRIMEIKNINILDELAKYFLSCHFESNDYKEKKRFSYYLNSIGNECSEIIQKEIFSFFLNSGKRYLRKYAYKNLCLNNIGLFDLAWQLVIENPSEATYLIHTIAYFYTDEFIFSHFNEVILCVGIEEYQIRKLFIRFPSLIN